MCLTCILEVYQTKKFVRSGFMDLLMHKLSIGELAPGDTVMADKGFGVAKELGETNMKLNISSFLGKRKQLSSE